MLRRSASLFARLVRRTLKVERLEDRLVLHCASPDPFICTPLPPTHEGMAVHIHPKLTIVINGEERNIPANVGITIGEGGQPTAFFPIHTHDDTGTLHVESPTAREFKLVNFMEIWGEHDFPNELLGFRVTAANPLRMTVNGQPSQEFGNLVLRDGQDIRLTLDTLTPAPQAGAFQFSAPVYTVAAAASSVTVTVSRVNGSQGTASVTYATADGTARAGTDYATASGDLSFAAGETSKTFTVSILNSRPPENKVFTVKLSNASTGASLGTPATAAVTIQRFVAPVDPEVNRNYVRQLYRDFYKREADAAGLDTWAGAIDRGTSRTDVMLALSGTQECYTKIVNDIYKQLLGRDADQAGINGFTAFLSAGGTVEQVKAAVCGSDEYFSKSGGNNAAYLGKLYRDTLGRDIEASGREAFTRALADGHTRGKVAEAVFGSAEYREGLTRSLYQQYFNRGADPVGLSFWTEALRVGTRDQHVRVGFLTSTEYVEKYARK